MPMILNGTTGLTLPTWETAGRPTSPNTGQTGFNSSYSIIEYYDGTEWLPVGFKPRTTTSTSVTSPLSWNSDNYDSYIITAQAGALTINADSGTPSNGQKFIFRLKDNGTARALTWTTGSAKSFRAVGVTLPTTTTISKTLYVGAVYNSNDSRWDVIATALEA
jgi:hypothetical protein